MNDHDLPIHTSRRAIHSSSSVLPSDGGGGDDWLRGNVGLHEPTCSSRQVMVRVTGSKDGMMAFSNTYMPIAMVDVHFVAASSHPLAARGRLGETTSRSRAGRSRWAGGRTDTTIVVLESLPNVLLV
jgi:hypothetical protein